MQQEHGGACQAGSLPSASPGGAEKVGVEKPDENNYIPVSLSDSDTDVAEAGADTPGIQPSATPLSDNFF